jgi:DNA-binding NtrC family response regulator
MPDLDGLELLRLLRQRAPDIDVLLMTAYDDMPTVVTAMREGAAEFLVKPLDLYQLRSVLKRIIADRRARHKATRAAIVDPPGEAIVGHDPRMLAVYKLIGQAASTRATVLIRGESGTGKELIARAIHMHSDARDEPFIAVNCAALPTTLLESELFGHVRGAFTGAVNARKGRFALAANGTIFLDEIGDTTMDFQTKLLRVLQNREYYPVGADAAETTDARVIAATHRDLESMLRERSFREDLYYRLRVVEIVVPPLRERPADIPLLAQHLVAATSVRLGTTQPVLTDDTIHALVDHAWPGNVRELENCIARAVVTCPGNVIRPSDLVLGDHHGGAVEMPPSLDEMERLHIERVLKITDGHKSRAAEILGISRPRLNRLLAKYGFE